MCEPADEEHDRGHGYHCLIREAIVLVDPEERLHAKDHLGDARNVNGLHEVVLRAETKLVDGLQGGINRRVILLLVALPERLPIVKPKVEVVKVVVHW